MGMLSEIAGAMEKAITEAKYNGEDSACYTYNCNDGYIDVWCNSRGDMDVVICQDDDKGREHPNIEDAIFNALPEWDRVEIDTDEPYSDYVRFYNRI